MEVFNNTTKNIKDDLIKAIEPHNRLSIAAACFSIYAYKELKSQLESIDELRFMFTSQTFTKEKEKRERREFFIPRLSRERSLYGSEFEIKLRNELSQKAIAKESADWIRHKVKFKSNMRKYSEQLRKTTNSVIHRKEGSDIDSFFKLGGTSALLSDITGLDDFELICFLIVKSGDDYA